jgi:hypothetical protein
MEAKKVGRPEVKDKRVSYTFMLPTSIRDTIFGKYKKSEIDKMFEALATQLSLRDVRRASIRPNGSSLSNIVYFGPSNKKKKK